MRSGHEVAELCGLLNPVNDSILSVYKIHVYKEEIIIQYSFHQPAAAWPSLLLMSHHASLWFGYTGCAQLLPMSPPSELTLLMEQLMLGSWLPSKQESESKKACSTQKLQPFCNPFLEVTPITFAIFYLLEVKGYWWTAIYHIHCFTTHTFHSFFPSFSPFFLIPFLSPSTYCESTTAQELYQALGLQNSENTEVPSLVEEKDSIKWTLSKLKSLTFLAIYMDFLNLFLIHVFKLILLWNTTSS